MINHMQGKSYVGNVKSYVKKMTKSGVEQIKCKFMQQKSHVEK